MVQRMFLVASVMLVLLVSFIPSVDARQDVYAFTYNGNNWYVDKDSVSRANADGLLHFTVYTMIGLRYDVASGSEYYNADVFYHDQKLSTEGGQLLYRNPGVLAATRVARQMPDAPKYAPKPAAPTPKPVVSKPTAIATAAAARAFTPPAVTTGVASQNVTTVKANTQFHRHTLMSMPSTSSQNEPNKEQNKQVPPGIM